MAFQNNLCNTANDLNWPVWWRHTNWTGVRQLDFYRSVHSATEWASNILVLQHPINKSWTCRLTRSTCCGSGARLSNLFKKFLGKWLNLQRSQEKVTIMLNFKTTEEILRKKLQKNYETLRKVKKLNLRKSWEFLSCELTTKLRRTWEKLRKILGKSWELLKIGPQNSLVQFICGEQAVSPLQTYCHAYAMLNFVTFVP